MRAAVPMPVRHNDTATGHCKHSAVNVAPPPTPQIKRNPNKKPSLRRCQSDAHADPTSSKGIHSTPCTTGAAELKHGGRSVEFGPQHPHTRRGCQNLLKVSQAKVQVETLVHLPCFPQPPTQSYWIATTQTDITSKRSGV